MSKEHDRVFFRNFSVVLGILALMIVIFIIIARTQGIDDEAIAVQRSDIVAENIAPVGEVRVAGAVEPEKVALQVVATAEPSAAANDESTAVGKQVYSGLCTSCHSTGIPGIPQLGNAADWTDRIAQGKDVLYDHAINGFTGSSGMPMLPKGGNMALSDDEVKAAVDYMVANSQ